MRPNQRLYVVEKFIEYLEIEVGGRRDHSELSLKSEDGMVGCLPVYSDKRKAKKVAGKKYGIVEIRVIS